MSNWRRDFVGLIAVGGFVAVGVLLLMGGVIDVTMKELALIVIGQLSMKFGTVVDYHYGSSANSAMKDQTASDIAKAAVQATGTGNGTPPSIILPATPAGATTTTTTTTKKGKP